MGFAYPIDAVVGHSRHLGVCLAKCVHVIWAALGLEDLGTQERGVADDHIGLGPLRGAAVRSDEGVGGDEIAVKVIEREGRLGNVQLVDGQFAGDHHGDLGDFDGEREDIEAV